MAKKPDLFGVAAPEDVPGILDAISDAYQESADELASSWGDADTGLIWNDFAKILNRAAQQCAAALKKRGF